MTKGNWILYGVATLALAGLGCSSDDESTQKKEITRVEVADSPFKPTDLEATIEDLIGALGDTEAETFEMSVITKPFGGYWEPVKVGANRAMAELDLTGQVEAPEDGDDADLVTADQLALLESRHEEGYGGIGLAPMREDLADEVDALVEEGVPVVTLDSDLAESKRQLYVGTNNAEAGKTAGNTLASFIDADEGTVIILGYDEKDWFDGYSRSMGAKEALEDAGLTVIVKRTGWSEEEIADDIAVLPELITTADPPVVGMVGMFSNAFRCAQVVEDLSYEPGDIKIAAFDFEPDTLKYMDNGYIQATHVQRQYYMGYVVPYAIYSIRALGLEKTVDLLGDQMIDDSRFNTGVDVVEADQVDDYNDFLDTLGIGG